MNFKTCGLHHFYPTFEVQNVYIFKELFFVKFWRYVRLVCMYSRAGYDGTSMVDNKVSSYPKSSILNWQKTAFFLLDSYLQKNKLIFHSMKFICTAVSVARFQISKCCSIGKTEWQHYMKSMNVILIHDADYRHESKNASDTSLFDFSVSLLS